MKSCGSFTSSHRYYSRWQQASCWPPAFSATAHPPDSSHRYHKLVWGPHGMDDSGHPSGVLIAGGENGNVILYDPAKIMAGESDVIIAESDRHTGPVRALDINPFQVWAFIFMFHLINAWTRCLWSVVIFECRLCCRQTWLHQVGMSLKSTSGTWIILALQWHQDQKPRCFIDFHLIATPTFYCFGLVSRCLTMAAVVCRACKCSF